MPRYENEGWNPKQRISNDDLDRTVPLEENYYSADPYVDLNFNNRTSRRQGDVVDNQNRQQGFNPCDLQETSDELTPPERYNREELPNTFVSETPQDFQQTQKAAQPGRTSQKRSRRDKPGRSKKSGKNANKKKLSAGTSILLVLLALILVVVGSVFPILGKINYDEPKDNQYVTAADLQSSAMVTNVLLLGVDARSEDAAESSRSDTMMLISVDMKHRTIKLTSFLRDTWVYIPCEDTEQRLNAACTYGGYSGVADTIEYNFGVKIDGYVVTDFEMFKVLVDAIGGVEVDVTEAEAKEVTNHKKRYGNVKLKSGKHNLTGEQALAYCRIRKIDTDFVRTKRQRTVMSAIIKKMKSSNPFTLYSMAYQAAPYIETDMSKGALMGLVAKAGICAGSIHQTRVPFEDTWSYANIRGNSVISIDKEENKKQLIDYIYNKTSDELAAEEAADE